VLRDDLLHPLRPPSLLAVEPPGAHPLPQDGCRRCSPHSRGFCTTGRGRTDGGVVAGWAFSREPGVVDIVDRYCAQLPVAIISDILGVPDNDRQRILEFGELAAPSLDFGLPWPQYRRVQRGIAGFNSWLDTHLDKLRRAPR